MAHAIEDMVYVGETPWHGLGTRIPEGTPVAEAVEICPAVGFRTTTLPLHYLSPEAPVEAKGWRAIVRDDTWACLGVATDRYQPVEYFIQQWAGLDPLIEAGVASIETLGSLKGGKVLWGLVKIDPEKIDALKAFADQVGEQLAPYALAVDQKDGKGCAIIAPTTVRVVCNNTLEAAKGGLTRCIKIRHVGNVADKIEAAGEELWGGMVKGFEGLSKRYALLSRTHLPVEDHQRLVQDVVATVPEDPDKFSSEAYFDGARERALAKRNAVYDLWFNGAGHKGNQTCWEALNGAVEALDHNRSGAFRKPRNGGKVLSMLTGTEANLKATITRNLVKFAAAA